VAFSSVFRLVAITGSEKREYKSSDVAKGHIAIIIENHPQVKYCVVIAGSSNGRTLGFGPRNRGSSPCPAVQSEAKR
jgi:hypothetical protein